MSEELRSLILAQAICDSLTLRSIGQRYVISEYYGEHYLFRLSYNNDTSEFLGRAKTYAQLKELCFNVLTDKISDT